MEKIYNMQSEYMIGGKVHMIFARNYKTQDELKAEFEKKQHYVDSGYTFSTLEATRDFKTNIGSYITDLQIQDVPDEAALKQITYKRHQLNIYVSEVENKVDKRGKPTGDYIISKVERVWEVTDKSYFSANVVMEESSDYNKTIIKG